MVSELWAYALSSHWKWDPVVRGRVFCTVLKFRKEVNPFSQAGAGGKNEFLFTGEMKWKIFLESGDFPVSEARRQRIKRGVYKDTYERKEANRP